MQPDTRSIEQDLQTIRTVTRAQAPVLRPEEESLLLAARTLKTRYDHHYSLDSTKHSIGMSHNIRYR
jgi:hypothetical protein